MTGDDRDVGNEWKGTFTSLLREESFRYCNSNKKNVLKDKGNNSHKSNISSNSGDSNNKNNDISSDSGYSNMSNVSSDSADSKNGKNKRHRRNDIVDNNKSSKVSSDSGDSNKNIGNFSTTTSAIITSNKITDSVTGCVKIGMRPTKCSI
uniref:Uncharacterized protein n=1 Tax=Octopus bimaculoides TaxID=37653 RepID=A0A0L8GGW5_OCTBM